MLIRSVALASLLTGTLSGCAALGADDDTGPSGAVTVAAAFYPLAFVADRVAGDLAEVELLTEPGGEPHDLELGIGETATLADADLVVYEAGFQAAVDEAVAQNAGGVVVEAGAVVGLEPFAEGEEGAGELDPHFWLDPVRMADLGDAVAAELARIDPDHADDYGRNAGDLRDELVDLDTRYADTLGSCERDVVVVSHDAFGYLGRYGLEVAPVAGLSPDAAPTAAGLSALQTLIAAEQVTTVFSERLAGSRFTDSLARDAGVGTAVLDPIEGLTDATAEEDYLSLMEQNLEALTRANGCA